MASWVPEPDVTVTPDPKLPRRHVASQRETEALRDQFRDARCVACGATHVELHHVVPRSQGGDDVAENIAPLCHPHHQAFEDHSPGWEKIAAYVRMYVWARASRLAYVDEKIGRERFDNRYPLPPFLAISDLDRYRTPDASLSEPEDHRSQASTSSLAPSGSESDDIEGYSKP